MATELTGKQLAALPEPDFLREIWGSAGNAVVEAASRVIPFNGNTKEFLDHCTACGGNWGGMLLTGMQKLFPEVYAVIPDDMGIFAWAGICTTLKLCGVNTAE